MVMALILDLALSAAERRLNDRRWRKPAPSWLRWTGGLVCAACAPDCSCSPCCPKAPPGPLVLYDGDYTEVKLMHRIIRLLVEDQTDLTVDIRDQMTQVNNYNALRGPSPSCDLMFTYDGTVLTTFLGRDTADIPAGESLFDYVNAQVAEDGLRAAGQGGPEQHLCRGRHRSGGPGIRPDHPQRPGRRSSRPGALGRSTSSSPRRAA